MTAVHEEHTRLRANALVSLNRVSWRLWLVVGLAVVAVALFLLVPDGSSIALLVLFGGLMALHHLPGGHGHGQTQRTRRSIPLDADSPRDDAVHAGHDGSRPANDRKDSSENHSRHCH